MRYFYDCEFIEDGKTIDLISIGVVAEDGREYYAISRDFKAKKASQWVKDNVLIHLPPKDPNPVYTSPRILEESRHWKRRDRIATDLLHFCHPDVHGYPEFWGWFSAYDHVALCQLYGTMMDLPEGWPMFTRDIEQWRVQLGIKELPKQKEGCHHALGDARWTKEAWEYLAARA